MKYWVLKIKEMKTIIKNNKLFLFLFGNQSMFCNNVNEDIVCYKSGFSSRVFMNFNQVVTLFRINGLKPFKNEFLRNASKFFKTNYLK
jgi:hypothetical protein